MIDNCDPDATLAQHIPEVSNKVLSKHESMAPLRKAGSHKGIILETAVDRFVSD